MADPGCVIVGLDPPRQPKRDDTDPAHWAKAMFHRVGPTRHTAVYRAITDSYSWAPEPIVEVDFFAVGGGRLGKLNWAASASTNG